jgi:histone deacetylase complex regulatory component SIN3
MTSSEWNKIWCTVDTANYTHLLGHQGITFKMMFKKALSTKVFAAQIKAIIEAQMARCAALMDPLYARTCL